MKKIMMLAAIAAAALSSCSNSEIVDISAGRAIGFETYVGKPSTKGAPVTGTSFADGATMKVWGYSSDAQLENTFTGVTLLPNLNGATVTKDASNWAYSPKAYWIDNKAHSFFACAPSADAGIAYSAGKITYTVQDAVDAQVDFMIADVLKNNVWNGTDEPTKQVFTFHHALSQIKYSAKLTQDATTDKATEVKVQKIVIENLGADGTTASTLSTTGTVDMVGKTGAGDVTYEGALSGTSNSYTVTPATAVTLAAATTAPEYVAVNHATDGVLMLMPQTTTGKVRFTVTLAYKDGSGTGQTAEAVFITTAAQTWAPNKIYHYKFGINMPNVLNQKPIEFGEPTISDWDTTENEVILPTP